jgi:hypothetical protein
LDFSISHVTNAWIIKSALPYVFMAWCIIKKRDTLLYLIPWKDIYYCYYYYYYYYYHY